MASVINILSYKKQVEQPVLVLAGLHVSQLAGQGSDDVTNALVHCAEALAAARSAKMPIAFVRCVAPPSSISEPRVYPAWLKGFEPERNDLVFDVTQPSCYSNAEFSRTMDYSNGNFVIAGLFAETTCLSTAIEAHHRRHVFTYLFDASASYNSGAVPAASFHDAISQLMSLYGTIAKTADWSLGLALSRKIN